jgi:thiol:disulfide interchange protein/DsbC/DsbD-like thiol-disulfide interchange protein
MKTARDYKKVTGTSWVSRASYAKVMMMIRTLLALLIGGSFALVARASEAISVSAQGASATVTQPHVTAELIPETTAVQAGHPFDVALHLHADAGWHTYWVNPGDAGLATMIKWTLPPGFTAGPIQWPTPEKHAMGGLMTYGYAGDVYLLTTITPPKDNLPQHFDIKAKATWLVCQEECIPGKAEFTLNLDSGLLNLKLPVDNKDFFDEARARLPVLSALWKVKASYAGAPIRLSNPSHQELIITFVDKSGGAANPPGKLYFFPEQANVLSDKQSTGTPNPEHNISKWLSIDLQQNGDKPDKLSGVLVSDQPLIGNAKAVYLAEFPVTSEVAAAVPSGGSAPSGGPDNSLSGSPQATGGDQQASAPAMDSSDGHRPPLQEDTVARSATATTAPAQGPAPATLIAVLGAAFVGGLILNLMPCVLPVLSLKVFSLMKHAGENPKAAWIQGVAFTAGVVLSFWVLAGLLIALRTAGNHIGWGFQMQNPGFVLALIFIFFLLGLNLFGVFELGSSLVGLDAKATGHLGGLASSFGNGALATVAATPCTAPFMGSALGFAAQQSAFISLLIFTFLALGMATPYLLFTLFPGALRFVPKPGAWMEAFKQFMGFLLMATVIFLVYVFGALTYQENVPMLLFVLLMAGLAAWIYGKWGSPLQNGASRAVAILLALALLGGSIAFGITLTDPKLRGLADARHTTTDGWQPWTQAAVDDALAKGQPVFVDFTAAWCLSCKVNERVALGTDEVKKAFTDKNVALFRADWTHADPAISQALQKYNRDGVPLYLLYSPKAPDAPQILHAVLTPGIVLDALKNL